MALDEMILSVIRLDNEQRVEFAKNCVLKICDGFARIGVSPDGMSKKICDVIRLFVSADKKCSQEEYDLINAVYDFDMSYDEFYDLTNGGLQVDFIRAMDKEIDSFDIDLKYHICFLGLCLLVSDDMVTEVEYALFCRILE